MRLAGGDADRRRATRRPTRSASSARRRATAARTLTASARGCAAAGLAAPRELEITGRDGYPVHGWVATPDGEGPFPVILQIHGGPYASYGVHVFDETQVLVDAGYAVVYCNPRGSVQVRARARASIRQSMGTVDHADVIDFFEGAVARRRASRRRSRRHHGRFVRRISHGVDHRARPPIRRGDRRARIPRPDLASRARATSARSSATSTSGSRPTTSRGRARWRWWSR